MAIGDYILCSKCKCKLLYDGDRGNRKWWEERFGEEEPQIECPDCRKKQEPVAWVCCGISSDEKHSIDYQQADVDAIPVGAMLYAAPPQHQPQIECNRCGRMIGGTA